MVNENISTCEFCSTPIDTEHIKDDNINFTKEVLK